MALFLAYMAVALPLAAIPVAVLHWPGYGNGLAGLAVGIAFFSTILSRNHAGQMADTKGGRPCMRTGLMVYVAASLICALAALPGLGDGSRYAILIMGRLLLGVGESLTIVGMLGWGIGLVGQARAGRVLAWTGAAMYGAFAVGGPIGLTLYQQAGLGVLMGASALLPLRFIHAHWPGAGLGLTCFGAAFVAGRFVCGHLPDRIGGLRVALLSLVVEAAGQYLLWIAPSPVLALAGALLTGAGCSMVFPALGVEVVRLVTPAMRATALGGFAAFQDLAYGATGPLAGLLADRCGYAVVFGLGGACATLGAGIVLALLARQRGGMT